MPGRHFDTLGGVIEGPMELHFRRIRVHLAGYIRLLLLRHAVDLRLVRLARGRDCGVMKVDRSVIDKHNRSNNRDIDHIRTLTIAALVNFSCFRSRPTETPIYCYFATCRVSPSREGPTRNFGRLIIHGMRKMFATSQLPFPLSLDFV